MGGVQQTKYQKMSYATNNSTLGSTPLAAAQSSNLQSTPGKIKVVFFILATNLWLFLNLDFIDSGLHTNPVGSTCTTIPT